MKRRVFNVASAISLLLCVATIVIWVRSYYRLDAFYWSHGGRTRVIVSPRGILGYLSTTDPMGRAGPGFHHVSEPQAQVHAFYPLGFKEYVEFAGFGCAYETGWRQPGPISIVHAPCWFLVAATLIVPALRWSRHRTEQRRVRWIAENRCGQCGYDLRATPERCPECGTECSR